MKALVKLLGVAAVFSVTTFLPVPTEAAPGYCTNRGQCTSESNVCTCPPGSYYEGLITTCGSYFAGICDEAA